MSRINTNVSSLIGQRVLNKNNNALNTSLQRLSTGLKINTGADDPAGLIASENLKAEQTGISTAIDNANRASNIIGTAEGGLGEVSSLLTELQGLVSQSANEGGLSAEELEANQLQVDSILSTINRIAGSTAFQG
jgi:flagellin